MKRSITHLSLLSLFLAFTLFVSAQPIVKIQKLTAVNSNIDPATVTNYTITMDFQITSICAGPCFGAKDANNFFMWQINIESGHAVFRPHSWLNGGGACHEDKDISSLITIVPNVTYALRIEIKGDKASTYINDILIDANRVNPRGGNYGFAKLGFRSGTQTEDAIFDNVKETTTVNAGEVILFQEDFSSATDFLFMNGSVIDNRFHPTINALSWQKKAPATYTIEEDFEINSIAAGPLFGMTDLNSYYMWQINIAANGKPANTVYFRPHVWKNGGVWNFKEVEISNKIVIQKNVVYHMRIELAGNVATTYINDILIDTSTEPTGDNYGMGKLGFRASFADAGHIPEQAYYDNVKITAASGAVSTTLFSEDFSGSQVAFTAGQIVSGRLYFAYVDTDIYSWQQALSSTTENTSPKAPSKYSIYPNPVKGYLNISTTPADYLITDLTGKMIQTGKGIAVNVAEFNSGVYLIRVNGSVSKFIKE